MKVKEYAQKHNISEETVRRYIRTGKLKAVLEGREYRIVEMGTVAKESDRSTTTNYDTDTTTYNTNLLRPVVELKDEQIKQMQSQIDDYREQISELHQLLAVAQKNVDHLTEQNQLLLEDLRPKRRWWNRLFAWNGA
jgi:predicted site-specific integrase-resolvase